MPPNVYQIQRGAIPKQPGAGGAGCGLFVFGFILSTVGFGLAWPCFRASRWPTVPGTVIESSIQTSRGSKGGTSYACRVSYWFMLNGTRYSGDKLDPVKISTSGNGAQEDHARFAPGTACEVHYNPEDPNESCLRPGPGAFQWTFITIGFLFFCGASAVWAVAWWKRGVPGA
ncbi:MAG: DUF3592 domain-containing protein [Planctomycetes bacterium]|nr:DUF3592 domain-containing protein [Planctomycetota bacterium]